MAARLSIRDRNKVAIGRGVDDAPAEPTSSTPEPTPAAAVAAPMPKKPARRPNPAAAVDAARKPAQGATAGTTRIGIYFQPEEFTDTKAAHLADWTNGGDADTFTRWIAAAIDAHAARTPAQRAKLARSEDRADSRGLTRTFNIPDDTVARMREGITADQGAGRWLSDSSWCGEAVAAARAAARGRNGGVLPTPPARLPNRLKR